VRVHLRPALCVREDDSRRLRLSPHPQGDQGHGGELASARFVVTRDRGKKYFGAFVPDLATARKLVEVVQKGVKDSAPEILCAKPETVRELALDLATGEVER
jgi:hypothetical protein